MNKSRDASKQFSSYHIGRILKVMLAAKRLQDMLFKIQPEGNTDCPASIMEDQLQGFVDTATEVMIDAIKHSKINMPKVF